MSPSLAATQTPDQDAVLVRAGLRPVWRGRWLIAVAVVIAAAGGYFLSWRHPKEYTASARVYVESADPASAVTSPQTPTLPNAQDMENFATLFTAQAITAVVDKQLGLVAGSATAGSVAVAPLAGPSSTPTSFLVVTATADSPALAANLANAYVTAFLESRRSAQASEATTDISTIKQELASLSKGSASLAARQTLLTETAQLHALALNPNAGATQTDVAIAPTSPSSPKPVHAAILGAILGLFIGLLLALGLEFHTRRMVGGSDVEYLFGLRSLAALPETPYPADPSGRHTVTPADFLEPIRGLRITLSLAAGDSPPRTILIASGLSGEGRSTVVRDLALVYAEAGQSVLVIDADLRRPSMGDLFGIDTRAGIASPDVPGLAQLLRGEAELDSVVLPVLPLDGKTAGENGHRALGRDDYARGGSVDLLSYSERAENPVALLASSAMQHVFEMAAERYDVVIVDSAPLLAVADSLPLLRFVDTVVLVVRVGLVTRESAARLRLLLESVPGVSLAGVVTNGVPRTHHYGGYEGYGEGYGRYGATPDAYAPLIPGDAE
jgi:non-specific protein-tyrosine kinase